MIFNTKCLWTLTITTLICVLANNLCNCKSAYEVLDNNSNIYGDRSRNKIIDDEAEKIATDEKRGWDNNFAVWGKRLYEDNPADKVDADLSIAQINPEKRKWSKFVSWGKRELPIVNDFEPNGQEPNNKREVELISEPLNIDEQVRPNWDTTQRLENDIDKRKWQAFTTWGKRRYNNMERPFKNNWSSFTSWGKRDSESELDDIDKRKWHFTSWGKRNAEPYMDDIDKRKWAKFASWGKREYDSLLKDMEKRGKWAKFTSWGKRSETTDALEAVKRKWAKFASWGKRDYGMNTDEVDSTPDKARWSPFASWGKLDDDKNETVEKRNWAKFASWGKRPRNPKAWLALNTWGKRRWSGLTTWGKRSGNDYKVETVARKLLRFFDLNGDGALDFDELHNYIRTLMSLPSTQETEEQIPEVE